LYETITQEEIALDKTMLKNELAKLALVLIALAVALKLAFYRQDITATTRAAFALWWMFTLPGYALLYYWREKLELAERIVLGTAAAAAVTAIASYYLGLLGLHVKYHAIVLPVAMIAVGIAANYRRKLTS
jgi:uncharacterized membrane protein